MTFQWTNKIKGRDRGKGWERDISCIQISISFHVLLLLSYNVAIFHFLDINSGHKYFPFIQMPKMFPFFLFAKDKNVAEKSISFYLENILDLFFLFFFLIYFFHLILFYIPFYWKENWKAISGVLLCIYLSWPSTRLRETNILKVLTYY